MRDLFARRDVHLDMEDERPGLTDRLRDLGSHPVPAATESDHLSRMAATPAEPARRFGRGAIAAAAIVGFLAGSTGLAAAGALPDPAQDVAHDVLAVVQVDVPKGKEGKRGPCVSEVAKRSDLSDAEKKAAKDACPKGGAQKDDAEDGDGAPGRSGSAPGQVKHADDPCRGNPPWAGNKDLTPEQKQALKDERAAVCGPDDDDVEDQEELENELEDDALVETGPDDSEKTSEPAPTTTATTTTTTATETTDDPDDDGASDEESDTSSSSTEPDN